MDENKLKELVDEAEKSFLRTRDWEEFNVRAEDYLPTIKSLMAIMGMTTKEIKQSAEKITQLEKEVADLKSDHSAHHRPLGVPIQIDNFSSYHKK